MNEYRFNGADYDPERDNPRLVPQFDRLFALMRDGKPRTLAEIALITGYPTPSISAQLRHMRKARFGGHNVVRHHLGRGLYEYRLEVNSNANS